MPPKNVETVTLPDVNPRALEGKTIVITGEIAGYPRSTAQKILENAGATLAKSLNKSVNLVVLGEEAGQKKLEKIEQMGIESKPWDEVFAGIQRASTGSASDTRDEAEDDDVEDDSDEEEPEQSKLSSKAKSKSKAKPAAKKSKPKAVDAKTSTPSINELPDDFSLADKKVLITGTVPEYTRKTATQLLESHNATVSSTLNADLHLVILGAKPGPDKMTKIAELGLPTVSWTVLTKRLSGRDADDVTESDDQDDEPQPQTLGAAPATIDGIVVLITGTIDGHTRASAEKALQARGARIAKAVKSDVELVVLGVNPGPDKLRKINELDIKTCLWQDLAKKLQLEDSAEPPKKKRKRKN